MVTLSTIRFCSCPSTVGDDIWLVNPIKDSYPRYIPSQRPRKSGGIHDPIGSFSDWLDKMNSPWQSLPFFHAFFRLSHLDIKWAMLFIPYGLGLAFIALVYAPDHSITPGLYSTLIDHHVWRLHSHYRKRYVLDTLKSNEILIQSRDFCPRRTPGMNHHHHYYYYSPPSKGLT